MKDEREQIRLYELYSRGEISEEAARVHLGERVDAMVEERESFEAAMDRDTSSFLR